MKKTPFVLIFLIICIILPTFVQCAEDPHPTYSTYYARITYSREITVRVEASEIGYMSGIYTMNGDIIQGIVNGTTYVPLRATLYYDSTEEFEVRIYYPNGTIYASEIIAVRFNENIKQDNVQSPALIFWSNYWYAILFVMIGCVGLIIIPRISNDKKENSIKRDRIASGSVFIDNGSVHDPCFDDDGNYLCDQK